MKTSNRTPVAPAVAMKPQEEPVVATPLPAIFIQDLTAARDVDIKTALQKLREESKKRHDKIAATQAQKGEKVRIKAAGRFNGKEGIVIISRKLRCFVDVPGFTQPAYVLHTDVEKVP